MSNVYQFPTKATRDLVLFEKTLRSLFDEQGIAGHMADTIVGRMKEIWNKYQRDIEISYSLPGTLNFADKQMIEGSINTLGDITESCG